MKITPQHEQYGLPHTAAEYVPESEIAEALRPRASVTPGLLNRAVSSYDEVDH